MQEGVKNYAGDSFEGEPTSGISHSSALSLCNLPVPQNFFDILPGKAPRLSRGWVSAFRQLSRAKQTTTRYAGGEKGYTKKLTDQLQ